MGEAGYDLASFHSYRDSGVRQFKSGQFGQAAESLRDALAEWRGGGLEDLVRFRFAADFAAAVEEERLVALQLRIDADLLSDRLESLLPELTVLTTQHPLREHFWGQLATVLYGLDRQADALNSLRRLRAILDTELGIDPSPSLQHLELRILRQELELGSATSDRGTDLAATVGEPLSEAPAELIASWGSLYPVFSRGVSIGRAADSDIVVSDDHASRRHAFVQVAEGNFTIVDLGSRNGVLVNGRRVVKEQHLDDGDVIRIGRGSLTLRFGSQTF